jgi:hypothetical protein
MLCRFLVISALVSATLFPPALEAQPTLLAPVLIRR